MTAVEGGHASFCFCCLLPCMPGDYTRLGEGWVLWDIGNTDMRQACHHHACRKNARKEGRKNQGGMPVALCLMGKSTWSATMPVPCSGGGELEWGCANYLPPPPACSIAWKLPEGSDITTTNNNLSPPNYHRLPHTGNGEQGGCANRNIGCVYATLLFCVLLLVGRKWIESRE